MEKIVELIKTICVCAILLSISIITISCLYVSNNQKYNVDDNMSVTWLLKNVTMDANIDDYWQDKYPYEMDMVDVYLNKVHDVKNILTSFCTNFFPFKDIIDTSAVYIKKMLCYGADEIAISYENDIYVSNPIREVVELRDELANRNIPLMYVQTPYKATVEYYLGVDINAEKKIIADRNYYLIKGLKQNNIYSLNIAEELVTVPKYDLTSHWYPQNALECTQMISSQLNDRFGFNISINSYDLDNMNNYLDSYPYENSCINESESNEYMIYVPCNDEYKLLLVYNEDEQWYGSFSDVMFHEKEQWNLTGGPYHDIFRIDNNAIYDIYNENPVCDKRIMIIGDSFNWPIASYLSLELSQITIVNNRSFTGSIIKLIEDRNPDMVLIVYNDAELYEIYTEEAFNFD